MRCMNDGDNITSVNKFTFYVISNYIHYDIFKGKA